MALASPAAADPAGSPPRCGDARAGEGNWASRPRLPLGVPVPAAPCGSGLPSGGHSENCQNEASVSGPASLLLSTVPALAGRESGSPWLSPGAPPLWWAACLNPLHSACCQMSGLQSKQDKGLFLDQGQTSQTTSICQVGLGQNVSSFGQHRARGPGQTLTPQTQVCKKSPISNFLPKCLLSSSSSWAYP